MIRRMLRWNEATGWLLSLSCSMLLFACSTSPVPLEAPAGVPPEPFRFRRILVMPFQDMSRVYGENVTVQCRICGNIFTTGSVEAGAEKVLTERMISMLKNRFPFDLVPQEQAEGVQSEILSSEKFELSEPALLARTGSGVDADAVFSGKIYRYIAREGTRFSVNSAASVAFEVDLIRVSDGKTVWSGKFDETQRSLFENLFQFSDFWKRRGKWVTAEDLAAEGLEKIFETFPAK